MLFCRLHDWLKFSMLPLALVGCEPTKDEGLDSPVPLTPYCKAHRHFRWNLDASFGDIDLNEMVRRVSGSYAGTWRHVPYGDGICQISLAPNFDGQPGTISVAYKHGSVFFVRFERVGCVEGSRCEENDLKCVDRMEVGMEVRFNSADGVLDEKWRGTLLVEDPRDPDFGYVLEDLTPIGEGLRIKALSADGTTNGSSLIDAQCSVSTEHFQETGILLSTYIDNAVMSRADLMGTYTLLSTSWLSRDHGVAPLYWFEPESSESSHEAM